MVGKEAAYKPQVYKSAYKSTATATCNQAHESLTSWHFLQNQLQWFFHQFSKEDGDSVISEAVEKHPECGKKVVSHN